MHSRPSSPPLPPRHALVLLLLLLLLPVLAQAFLPPLPLLRPHLTRCESSLDDRRATKGTAAAPAATARRVEFEGFDVAHGPSVGDTLSVVYNPLGQGLDPPLRRLEEDEAASPCLLYNFNGWDGEETPLRTPLFPRGDGTLMATVHVPNYAKVLDCIVSDGQLGFDMEGGAYFHLHIANVQEEKEGVVYNFRQAEDGTLTLTGVESNNDAQELERMIEDELLARSSAAKMGGGGGTGVAAEGDEASFITMEEEEDVQQLADELLVDTGAASVGGEAARQLASTGSIGVHVAAHEGGGPGNVPQQLRLEATAVGEALGISSSMIINELREAFDSVTDADVLLFEDELPRALARMGFDGLDTTELDQLCTRIQGQEQRPSERRITLEHFMRMFHVLDQENVGITIV